MKKTEKLNALFDKWQNKQKVEPPDSLKNTKIESNKILIQTNASFVRNVNTKIDDIEHKVDNIMEKLG